MIINRNKSESVTDRARSVNGSDVVDNGDDGEDDDDVVLLRSGATVGIGRSDLRSAQLLLRVVLGLVWTDDGGVLEDSIILVKTCKLSSRLQGMLSMSSSES
jgi:hypothetical protein